MQWRRSPKSAAAKNQQCHTTTSSSRQTSLASLSPSFEKGKAETRMAGSSSSPSAAAAALAAASSAADNNTNSTNNPMAMPPTPKATIPMATALSHLRSTLTCPLCAHPYTLPHTLPSCGHTFCLHCISDYACNSWECPYEGCSVPITIGKECGCGGGDGRRQVGGGGVSGRGGGFVRANPILEGCVESLGRVLKELHEAEDGWWRDAADVRRDRGKGKGKKKGKEGKKGGGGIEKGGKRKRGGSSTATASGKDNDKSSKTKKRLELSDVYYPEGGGGGNDAYDCDDIDDDDDGHARRSAVTFDVGRNRNNRGGESGDEDDDDDEDEDEEEEEEPVDFNPPSDDDDEEEALTTTPKDINVGDASSSSSPTSTVCPETATKSQRDALLLLSGASAGMGGGGGAGTNAAAAVDTTVLPGERNSLMGGLLGPSARSHREDPAAEEDAGSTNASHASTDASASVGTSQPNHHHLDRTVRPDERASLLGGLGLSAASASAEDHDRARDSSIAGTDAGSGAAAGGRRLDATVLLGQKDSLLHNDNSDLEDFCTAASKQDVGEDEDQMTDGTATTNNTNRYFTGREEDGSEDEEDGQHDDGNGNEDSDATDIDEDVVGQDSEATVSHSMPSPSTERKSNISRSRNNSSSNLPRLSRVDTMDSAAGDEANTRGDLSTLEEGSCETSMNTTGTSNVSHQAKGCGGHADAGAAADDTMQEPSQCQSLVGHVKTMERRLDSALADAMRSPSPRVNTSGRSGLDQSCAIPQGDDFEVDDDEGPVFGSQGLSPIMLAGSQMDPTFDYGEEAEEEESDEGMDQKKKAKSTQNDSKPIDESKPESPPNSDSKKRKAATPSNTARGLRESTRASFAECKPRVFFLSHSSALSAAHVRTVRKCIKSNKLSPIGDGADHVSGTDNSDLDIPYDFETPNGIASFISVLKATKDAGGTVYGVSTNSEYQYTDGYIVPRSFRYLLGVAAGLPMVDIDFLTNNANANGRGPMGRYLLPAGAGTTESTDGGGPDDCGRSKRARRGPSDNVDPFRDPQSGCPYVVCGDTDAKEIGAPQRSIASKQGLFDGYTILLFGDFDHIAPATSKAGGRKRRGAASSAASKVDDSNLYSQGRVSALLQLSGANVAGLKDVVEASEAKTSSSSTSVPSNLRGVMAVLRSGSGRRTNDNIVVLIKCKATAKDYKQANRYLKDYGDSLGLVDSSMVPVLSADWALDSISDFFLRKCDEYSK